MKKVVLVLVAILATFFTDKSVSAQTTQVHQPRFHFQLSPDGKQIAYLQAVGQQPLVIQVWIANSDGTQTHKLTDSYNNQSHLVWSPNNATIALNEIKEDSSEYTIIDMHTAQKLTESRGSVRTFTPDSKGVIVEYSGADSTQPGSYLTLLDGTVNLKFLSGGIGFAYSPNGKQIAYRALASDFENIYLMQADGSNVQKLANGNGNPKWSADGTTIGFVTSDGNDLAMIRNWWLQTILLPSKTVTLVHQGKGVPDFQWSPVTNSIIVTDKNQQGDDEILSLNLGSQQWLTNTMDSNLEPEWSPDGKTIYFASMRSGYEDIYTMNEAGKNQLLLIPQP